jgi:hypothetical protein
MSGETPLIGPIEGYRIALTKEGEVIDDFQLKLSKVGGAHITNAEDLIMLIEDAVFKEENSGRVLK